MKPRLLLCKKCPFYSKDNFPPQRECDKILKDSCITTNNCEKNGIKITTSIHGDNSQTIINDKFEIPIDCHLSLEHFFAEPYSDLELREFI